MPCGRIDIAYLYRSETLSKHIHSNCLQRGGQYFIHRHATTLAALSLWRLHGMTRGGSRYLPRSSRVALRHKIQCARRSAPVAEAGGSRGKLRCFLFGREHVYGPIVLPRQAYLLERCKSCAERRAAPTGRSKLFNVGLYTAFLRNCPDDRMHLRSMALCLGQHYGGAPPCLQGRARQRKNYEAKKAQTRSCIFGQLIAQYTLPVFDRSRGDGA
jgi:hypothetical protein